MRLRFPLPARPRVAFLALLLLGASCKKLDLVEEPDANAWNLGQLHNASGSYRYTADLVGDLEYVMRAGTSGLPLKSSQERALGQDTKPVKNPAKETLKNLLDLAQFQREDIDERIAGLQVMWFTRLAVTDPSALARERCVLELGRLGKRVEIDLPVPLPPDAEPIGPKELGDLLTDLIRSYRETLGSGQPDPGQLARLDAACREIEEVLLDLESGRRVLYATNNLLRTIGRRKPARAPLVRLNRHTQRKCIELALAEALGDERPMVRAAALESSVEGYGRDVLAPVLMQLSGESSDLVQTTAMRLVGEHGLPGPLPGMPEDVYQQARQNWIRVIYLRAISPEGDGTVRIAAMQALQSLMPPAVESLREEDWEEWWFTTGEEQAGGAEPLAAPPEPPAESPVPAGEEPTEEPTEGAEEPGP